RQGRVRGHARHGGLTLRRAHRCRRHRHRDLPHDPSGHQQRPHGLRRPLVISRGVLVLALALASCEDAARTLPLEFPDKLSQAGLYEDLLTRKLASNVIAFAPDHKLWSDGAEKARWILLPDGKQIDGSDPDHWVFPIGTRFFKEFSLEGRPLETRLIL